MPKSTKILLVIAVVLGIGAFFAYRKGNTGNTIQSEENLYAVLDSGRVNKIVLKHKEKEILLEQKNGIWVVNNNFTADHIKLSALLNFIYKVRIKRPVYKEHVPLVAGRLKKNGITVSSFTDGQLIKQYTLLPDTTDQSAVYAISDEGGVPYSLTFSAEEGANELFSVTPEDWRSKMVFSSNVKSIKVLEVTFTKTPSESYRIESGFGGFSIVNMPRFDSLRLFSYLDLYKDVKIKAFISENKQKIKDSLLLSSPAFTISLEDRNPQKSNTIKIYFKEGQQSKIMALMGPEDQPVYIRPSIFEYLLQKRSFFERKK